MTTPAQVEALQSSIVTWGEIEKAHFELYIAGSGDAKRHHRLAHQAHMVVSALRLYKVELER